jgi:hypothetical protein
MDTYISLKGVNMLRGTSFFHAMNHDEYDLSELPSETQRLVDRLRLNVNTVECDAT